MAKTRLEAFSDGVLAIIITILVLELKVPHGEDFGALKPLLPFVTSWMDENHFAAMPTALCGFVLLMAAIAYWILQRAIISAEGKDALLAKAIGKDRKGNLSVLIYGAAIPIAFVSPGYRSCAMWRLGSSGSCRIAASRGAGGSRRRGPARPRAP